MKSEVFTFIIPALVENIEKRKFFIKKLDQLGHRVFEHQMIMRGPGYYILMIDCDGFYSMLQINFSTGELKLRKGDWVDHDKFKKVVEVLAFYFEEINEKKELLLAPSKVVQ